MRISDWSSDVCSSDLGTSCDGHFDLQLPDEAGASPVLDLDANFAVQDVNRLKPFMLLHWSEHLRDWLTNSLKRGHASRGELMIHGPLADFPFTKHPDRKSVVSGKSVSVRVKLGGRRIIKK